MNRWLREEGKSLQERRERQRQTERNQTYTRVQIEHNSETEHCRQKEWVKRLLRGRNKLGVKQEQGLCICSGMDEQKWLTVPTANKI